MHYGKYGLKEIVAKQDMENEFFWIRNNYYTDLLKLFVCRDIDDYENYKLDLYFTFHFLNIVKETQKTPSLRYLKDELLKCKKELMDENIRLAVNWYNERIDCLFEGTEKEGCIDKIDINKLNKEEFEKFIIDYSNWLTKELCSNINHEVSLDEVNRKINKLLYWDEVYEYKKKRAKEAFEDGFVDLFSGLCKDKSIYINRNKQYNLSCDSLYGDYLCELGATFIGLFDKVYQVDYKDENVKVKILNEMQDIFNFVKKLGPTNDNAIMTDGDIRDSFLTCYSPEAILPMTKRESIKYDKFCTYLLCFESVFKAFEMIDIK